MSPGRSTVAAILLAVAAGCSSSAPPDDRQLVVRGSDTMLVLNRRLAEEFMRSHPGVSVRVDGGGTAAGAAALAAGEADIGAASRPLLAEEVAAIFQRHATLGVRFLVAQDALSVFVNAANPVRSLGLDQLRGLFDGSVRSWAEVGGADEPVVVVVRPPSSGSHRFFRDHVLKGRPYAAGAITVTTTTDVLTAVSSCAGCVGYGGVAYHMDGVASVAIDGEPPSTQAVRAGLYPLARYLAFYTVEPPTGLARQFIDWSLGPEGQSVVAEVGYTPLWAQ